jgi:hypothetical protein
MADTDPIPDHVLRVLRYVALVEDGGARLTTFGIDRYAGQEVPARVNLLDRLLASSNWFAMNQMGSMADYFLRVGWLDPKTFGLTSIGRAIVKATAERSEEAATSAVILSPSDPLNYAVLTREVAAARSGLLLDPYATFEYLAWLYQSTSIVRLLIGRDENGRRDSENQASMRLALGGIERAGGRALEVRQLPRDSLHDRVLIGEDDSVSLMGASLNGLHKNFTAIVPLPEPAATALREYVEGLWAKAVRLEPQPDLRQQPDLRPEAPPDVLEAEPQA